MSKPTIDYKALFNAMPVARFLVQQDAGGEYVVLDANKSAWAMFERGAVAALPHPLRDLVPAVAVPDFQDGLQRAAAGVQPVIVKTHHDLPGSVLPGEFIINAVRSGEAVTFDVMAQPAAGSNVSLEQERDDAISMLTSVFDVSEVGILVTDRDLRIIRINDSFMRIYGWAKEEIIGHDFADLIAPDERARARRNHEEFMVNGIRSSGEMKLIRRDHSTADTLFTTAALELSHGRRFQVTTIMDITMRKQMETTLRLAKEQADSANQAKSMFLANMSHELRTPLNAIIGFSEMMMKETFGPLANDRYLEYMGDIHVSARHLLEIINEVLDMSKIEAGKVELDEEYFDVNHLVTAVNRMMDSRAFSSGLKIHEHVQESLPPLYADPRLVRQILINLVGNAVKYTNAGGVIDVSAQTTPGGDLRIVVADTGMGIPRDRIREALEPFGQVNKSASEAGGIQGTGLGLPLAKAMVELHGGSLSLDSDVGKGTRVFVELPGWRLGDNLQKRTASPLAALARKKKTI